MTKLYNRSSELSKRRRLRKDSTYAERAMWNALRENRMLGFAFRRQYSVGAFVLDFYCPILKLAIEVDGASHEGAEQQRKDALRQHWIETFGITFLRFSDTEVLYDSDRTLERNKTKISRTDDSQCLI